MSEDMQAAAMTRKVTPFLMFTGHAEEAMNFYVAHFPDAYIIKLERFGPGEPGAEGSVKRGAFALAGQSFMCFDSPPVHKFTFTPAISIFVECESSEEIERLCAKLSEDGEVLMPLGAYGFSQRFGWVNDRFGVSWQLNLA